MINLLPEKIKREQKLNQISRMVNSGIFALLLMVGLAYSAVFLVNYFISSQMDKNNQLLDQTRVSISKLKPIEDDVNNINAKISKLDTLKSKRFEWSALLNDFNNSIPKSVQINSLQMDTESQKFSLTAAADSRSDIVKLQAKLQEISYLKDLSFASSTFDDKNDYYTFTMSGKISK